MTSAQPKSARRLLTMTVAAAALGACLTSTATASATPVVSARSAAAPVVVTVRGQVHHRLRLTLTDLGRLPRHTVTVTFQSRSGAQTHTYAGPLLYDVIEKAEPVVRTDVKNDLLRDYVSATAAGDGYQALVSWAEIDPAYEGKQVLLAQEEDGTALTSSSLVLVVPGDAHGGRYVSGVTSLRLGHVHG